MLKNILVPVDFSTNTAVSISKALELSNTGTTIHLLHVEKKSDLFSLFTSFSFFKTSPGSKRQSYAKHPDLYSLKKQILELNAGIQVTCEIVQGVSLKKAIIGKALKVTADLIIIGKHSNHFVSFLNTLLPNQLAEEASCAVLTVKPGSLNNKIKLVVIPVTNYVPQTKMNAVAMVCQNSRLNIHLVTFTHGKNTTNDFNTSSLLKAYQWLKASLHCTVEHTALHGKNKAQALLNYVKKIDADILLVDPVLETRIGWRNRDISDLLPPASKVLVLAVHPVG